MDSINSSNLLREQGIIGGVAYCVMCTEKIEFCRCEAGEGANRLAIFYWAFEDVVVREE